MFIVSIVLFTLVNLAPGGPLAGRGQSRRLRPEQIAMLKRQFGLDQPFHMRLFFGWWGTLDKNRYRWDGIRIVRAMVEASCEAISGMSIAPRTPVIKSIKNLEEHGLSDVCDTGRV
jgi:hypothetical protein